VLIHINMSSPPRQWGVSQPCAASGRHCRLPVYRNRSCNSQPRSPFRSVRKADLNCPARAASWPVRERVAPQATVKGRLRRFFYLEALKNSANAALIRGPS